MQVDGHGLAEQVHVRFPQGLDGTNVLPVALEIVGNHLLTVIQHGGDDVLAEVVGGGLVVFVGNQVRTELRPGEDVDTHGGLVGLGLLGLLFELDDAVLSVGVHDTEAGGFLPRHGTNGDSGVSTLLDMVLQHGIVVHLVNVVTGQDQHVIGIILLDEGHVLVDGVGGAAIPVAGLAGLVGGQDEHAAVGKVQIPRSAGADVAVQLQGHKLGQHAHGINTAVGAVGQREVDDAVLAAIGNGRLGNLLGQNAQTGTLAASQQHGDTSLLLHGNTLLNPLSCGTG